MIEACVEFITLISSEANEISEKDSKKTISAEHVAAALKELGFEAYVEPVLESAEEFKKSQAVSDTIYIIDSELSVVMVVRINADHSRNRAARKNKTRSMPAAVQPRN